MAKTEQVAVRILFADLAKIDRLAEVLGVRRGTLLRRAVADFADTAEDLATAVERAWFKGNAANAEAFIREYVDYVKHGRTELRFPVDDLEPEP